MNRPPLNLRYLPPQNPMSPASHTRPSANPCIPSHARQSEPSDNAPSTGGVIAPHHEGLPAPGNGTACMPSMPTAQSLFVAASALTITTGVLVAAWSVGHPHTNGGPSPSHLPYPPTNASDNSAGTILQDGLIAAAVMVALNALNLI